MGSEPCSLLWVDIETTGLDRNRDMLLELACFITDPNGDNPRDYEQWLVKPDCDYEKLMIDIVHDMHVDSGLINDLDTEQSCSDLNFCEEFEYYVADHLANDPSIVGSKFTMAGSGVGPFDLPFLLENYRFLTSYFNYYVMDVGVVGRFLNHTAGMERPTAPEDIVHRAMDDIKDHYNEFMFYRGLVEFK